MKLREISEPVLLSYPDGSLNRDAVGYSRRPLHICNLPTGWRAWGRNKRWEYWGLVTPTHIVGLTIASLDYAGLLQVYVLDRRSGESFNEDKVVPLASGIRFQDTPTGVDAFYEGEPRLAFHTHQQGTQLTVHSKRVQLDAVAMAEGDALGVVVPWTDRLYQYTLKHVAQRVGGTLTIDGEALALHPDHCFAVLDRGRGRWPRRITWNWGAGFGHVGGASFGLQVGGQWTDGTGSTENAVVIDGRLEHIPETLEWRYDLKAPEQPWHIESASLRATLTPFHVRRAATNAWVVRSSTHQAFGHWAGVYRGADGVEHAFDGLVGWAEEAANLW